MVKNLVKLVNHYAELLVVQQWIYAISFKGGNQRLLGKSKSCADPEEGQGSRPPEKSQKYRVS